MSAGSSEVWSERRTRRDQELAEKSYVVFAADACTELATRLQAADPARFDYLPIEWGKFADGTDRIKISGFSPQNKIAGMHCLFLAAFHNNDVTLSQFSVFIVLLQSFVESLTIVLPYFPVGTMERVDQEGIVATANTYGILLSSLPLAGKPSRLMIYDIHALQNRFYFRDSVIPSLHSAIPLLLERLYISDFASSDYIPSSTKTMIKSLSTGMLSGDDHGRLDGSASSNIRTVAFPDEGAAKRFAHIFAELGFSAVVCGKVRRGDKRIVTIHDGDCDGKEVIIVDDLIQTGGTLYEAACALKAAGATKVYAFVAHAVFPHESWRPFCVGGSKHIFEKFWVTNSVPLVAKTLPTDDVFEVLDLLPLIVRDLSAFYS